MHTGQPTEEQLQQIHEQQMSEEYIAGQIQALNRILPLRRLQHELSDLNTKMAINSVNELRAHIALEQMMNPQGEGQPGEQTETPAEDQQDAS